MSNKIKYLRIVKENKTLEDLAEATNLSVGYLSHLENGSRENPSKETMDNISAALNSDTPKVFYSQMTMEEIQELANLCNIKQ